MKMSKKEVFFLPKDNVEHDEKLLTDSELTFAQNYFNIQFYFSEMFSSRLFFSMNNGFPCLINTCKFYGLNICENDNLLRKGKLISSSPVRNGS